MRILIADDERDIRTLFTMLLSSISPDVQLDVVVNGAEAVDAVRNGNYDIVLMDFQMPEKDGYQAAVEIHKVCEDDDLKVPFIFFCTGLSLSDGVKELLADTAHYGLLKKPITSHHILEVISKFHVRARMQREDGAV